MTLKSERTEDPALQRTTNPLKGGMRISKSAGYFDLKPVTQSVSKPFSSETFFRDRHLYRRYGAESGVLTAQGGGDRDNL